MMWLAAVAAALATLAATALWFRSRHLVVTVRGPSMLPTYHHGDRVLVRRRAGARVGRGEIAVVDLPDEVRPVPAGVSAAEALRNRRVIKRVAATGGEAAPPQMKTFGERVPAGHLVLLGDNPDGSGDSRMYGFVPARSVIGVVVRRLRG